MEEKNIIAIEIGSSKIKGALGIYSPQGVLTVKTVEEEPLLDFVRYGAVSNVEETAKLVARIIRKIENQVVPRKISTVYVALGGRSCCSVRRDVETQLSEEMEITDQILRGLRDEVSATQLSDRDLFAVVPRQYIIDKTVVAHPKGTVGRNIRFSANLITCRPTSKRNIDILFHDKLQLNVGGYEVRQLALGDLVITKDEKRLGCMLVDFGAETTAVSIYKDGHLQYMATLPLGSRNITRDITELKYLEEKAEEIKCKEGNASGNATPHQHPGGVDYTPVNNYVSHRAGEIIANIRKQIDYAGFKATDLSAGIIIVGRGARLAGFNDRLSKTAGMNLRVGSITAPEIRIADSRISAADASDVIAVLYKAAIHGAQECLTNDVVDLTQEEEPVIEEQVPEPVIDPIAEEPEKRKKGGFFKDLKNKFGKFLDENEDDDDELKDDAD